MLYACGEPWLALLFSALSKHLMPEMSSIILVLCVLLNSDPCWKFHAWKILQVGAWSLFCKLVPDLYPYQKEIYLVWDIFCSLFCPFKKLHSLVRVQLSWRRFKIHQIRKKDVNEDSPKKRKMSSSTRSREEKESYSENTLFLHVRPCHAWKYCAVCRICSQVLNHPNSTVLDFFFTILFG